MTPAPEIQLLSHYVFMGTNDFLQDEYRSDIKNTASQSFLEGLNH